MMNHMRKYGAAKTLAVVESAAQMGEPDICKVLAKGAA
jgi:hypothetical protein